MQHSASVTSKALSCFSSPFTLSAALFILLHISPLELECLTLLAHPMSLSHLGVPLASELQVSSQNPTAQCILLS